MRFKPVFYIPKKSIPKDCKSIDFLKKRIDKIIIEANRYRHKDRDGVYRDAFLSLALKNFNKQCEEALKKGGKNAVQ